MSGVKGQKSEHSRELPARYREDLLDGVDGRCREARRWRDRLQLLIVECGGSEHLSRTELEILARYVHHSRRMAKTERRELLGERINEAAMNDGLRCWLGLLSRVELIKARRRPDGQDLARALQEALKAESEGIE